MLVIIRALECLRTKLGERTEEPYLCIFRDDRPPERLGPYKMHDGDIEEFPLNNFRGDTIKITLSEEDPGSDDFLNGVRIIGPSTKVIETVDYPWRREKQLHYPGTGSYIIDCPWTSDGRYDRNDRHYRIYIDVQMNPNDLLPSLPYYLELISLECNDAQEWKDYVYINVNSSRWFGPRRMRSGSIARIDPVIRIPTSYFTKIRLYEQDDSTRDDFFGELRLFNWPGVTVLGQTQTHIFHADEGIVGDATYTLTYRVTEREIE
jgi:hypothetical protein